MDISGVLGKIINHTDLESDEMVGVMRAIMTGQVTDAQLGGFLVGLRMKGESVLEITAAASVMRELSTKINVSKENLVDTCGTGGDHSGSFNISTASAFVVAAAGGRVAKHGNRSVSSKTGSADVLEVAGVNLNIGLNKIEQCINEIGIGFLFAQKHHNAMKHAIGVRKALKQRTLFNLLGPLTNPAGTPNQVLGVFSEEWLTPLAKVLQRLGSRHVMLVHAEAGLDEISIQGRTHVVELKNNVIQRYLIEAKDFNLAEQGLSEIKVESAEDSLKMIHSVFSGEKSAARDIIILNAGAGIYVANITESLASGIEKAGEMLDNGFAGKKLAELVEYTNT